MTAMRLERPNYARAAQRAADLLAEFGYEDPPVNPAEIARGLGMKVYFVTFGAELSKISGYYDPNDNSISVNTDEYPQRQTFTIAHELGHKLLHEEWANSNDYQVLLRDSERQDIDPIEQEANCFAANLLVPKSMLRRYRHQDTESLATLFAVSRPTITWRIKNEFS